MEFKGKYKDWYYRLVKANYGARYGKEQNERIVQLVKLYIEWEGEGFWKNKREKLEKDIKDKDKIDKILGYERKRYNGEERIKGIEWTRERDLELLKKAIPKQELEDGAWYDCEEGAKNVARFGGIVQWNEKRQEFRAPGQQQFGADGYLDHWADVIDEGYAGFVPMWKVKKE